jgi:hypothetical protein
VRSQLNARVVRRHKSLEIRLSQERTPEEQAVARAQIHLTNRITRWLRSAGVTDEGARSTLAVGLADTLYAMEVSAREIRALLATDPTTESGASQALHHCGMLGAYLFGEVHDHLADMLVVWEPAFEDKLAAKLPPDPEESE